MSLWSEHPRPPTDLGLGRLGDALVTGAFQFHDGGIKKGGGISPTALGLESGRSGRGRDVVTLFLGARLAGAPARLWGFLFAIVLTSPNGRREHA